jgi:hypothetical protein
MMPKMVRSFLFILVILAIALPAMPQQAEVGYPVHFDISPPMRDIVAPPQAPDTTLSRPLLAVPRVPQAPQYDPALQNTPGSAINATPGLDFEGIGVPNSCNCAPPDTNMAVGPAHIVQWVNTSYAVYSKAGSVLKPPTAGNSFWAGFGGPCETTNSGDPIAQYDAVADRWVMSQLAISGGFFGPNFQCFAVSTTSDPTGTYARYAYNFGSDLNDYPKIGVWPVAYTGAPRGAYFASYNIFAFGISFSGPRPCAYNRDKMLSGVAGAEQVCFQQSSSVGSLLPTDLDGGTATSGTLPPPAGEPGFYFDYGTNELLMWKFTPNFATPANSTFTGPQHITVDAFSALSGGVPQAPGDGTTLDTLSDRLMYRNAYRNFGDHEAVLVSQSVNAGSSGGVRWYEIRSPNSTPTRFQNGTFAPNSTYRWMSSIAGDKNGDIAIGYSASDSSIHPAIRYTGREPGDALGTMQSENSIIEGTGSQTGGLSRWGDYSAMRIDPLDDCTFWYTTEYIQTDGSFNWHTRVGSFKFNGCGVPPTPPLPPSNLTATAINSHRIDLAWTDNSDNETGFRIERCTGDTLTCAAGPFSPIATVGANVTTYSDTTVAASTTYTYRVWSFNGAGDSATPSNTAEAMTPAPPAPPAAPSDLTATPVSSSQINLSWTDNSNNEDGFKIERCVGAGCSNFTPLATVGANVKTYSDTGLAPSTTYRYRVYAFNDGGNSGYSNEAEATTLPGPPAAPSNLTATPSKPPTPFVDLAWTDNSNNEGEFDVYRCTGAGCTPNTLIATLLPNSTTYHDAAVVRRTTYRYQVFAKNTSGSSGSNIATATTK